MARIGPNPVARDLARHVPRIGAWAGLCVAFFGWPLLGKVANDKGYWYL
jgi:hypothetical protein